MDETFITKVDESAFWHTNIELNYGYLEGEVVEVEHGPNKYWLAQIIYSYKNLVLLSWVHGELDKIGEFWVDTSNQDCIKSVLVGWLGCNAKNHSSTILRRLFPLGHHLQAPLKFQYTLERPKLLVNPTLYDPSKDPYANVKNVEDLLNFELDQSKDVLASLSSGYSNQAQENKISIANSVAYGQEDVDELEAALQNLNDQLEPVDNQDDSCLLGTTTSKNHAADHANQLSPVSNLKQTDNNLKQESDIKSVIEDVIAEATTTPKQSAVISETASDEKTSKATESERDQKAIAYCKKLQNDAVTLGRIILETKSKTKSIVYYTKARAFYESGGYNHDRLLVPGTILECCYHVQSGNTRRLHHWFVIVLKNQGGRLTLRWFACDQPKFKQGRLELKTIKSEFVKEEDEDDENKQDDNEHESDESSSKARISAKELTFQMHYCDPRLFEFGFTEEEQTSRSYRVPDIISGILFTNPSSCDAQTWADNQRSHLFNPKRLSLDVNRYCIKELISHVRWLRPRYLEIEFAKQDETSNRQVLIFTSSTVRLIRGHVVDDIARDVFLVRSEPSEEGSVLEFVYPYDTSYGILPVSWAYDNPDCLKPREGQSSLSEELNSSGSIDDAKLTGCAKSLNKPNELPHITFEPSVEHMTRATIDEQLSEIQFNFLRDRYELMHEVSADLTKNSTTADFLNPFYRAILSNDHSDKSKQFHCALDRNCQHKFHRYFTNMRQVEVVHPNSSVTMCEGRIRKAAYPLLWIQISADSYTVLPFNSCNIYPTGWCARNDFALVALLPPRKRASTIVAPTNSDRKRRKTKVSLTEKRKDNEINENDLHDNKMPNSRNCDEDQHEQDSDHLDLNSLNDKQLDIDYITTEKSSYISIYFNHKCFTGPSLSKGKICSLPQYVGPGPMRLVMEEVVTKLISVAYVPPRILNDLNSQAFKDLLVARNLINTIPMTFKAKYQKRVHREEIPVCLKLDDVLAYCNCMCEHLKCCYNLFGPNLYDGDDCPSHCRVLTKSNKFMKRALYYREKAKNGEFTSDNNNQSSTKKSSQTSAPQASSNYADGDNNKTTSRPRYGGRDSFESVSSRSSRSELVNSRASSAGVDDVSSNGTLKENLDTVAEPMDVEADPDQDSRPKSAFEDQYQPVMADRGSARAVLNSSLSEEHFSNMQSPAELATGQKPVPKWKMHNPTEFSMLTSQSSPAEWTIDEVSEALDACNLGRFKQDLICEGVDGSALLLLDKFSIREHFLQTPEMDYTQEEMSKLCRFVEYLRNRLDAFE